MTTEPGIAQESLESLQRGLPNGLVLLRELNDGVEERRTFEISDRRLSQEYPVRKILWLIEISRANDRERADLLSRIQKLCQLGGNSQNNFMAPQEAFLTKDTGDLCLIISEYASVLSQTLPATEIDPKLAKKLLLQILEGLSDLHRVELAHGGVRPENISLSTTQITDHCSARLLGLNVIDRLETNPEVQRIDDRTYHPPEWSTSDRHPTQSADVYSIGVLTCRLLFGPEAVQSPVNLENSRKELQKHRTWKWVAAALAPIPESRPATALQLQELHRRFRRRRMIAWRVASFAGILLLFGWGISSYSNAARPATTLNPVPEATGGNGTPVTHLPDPEIEELRQREKDAKEILQRSDQNDPRQHLNALRTLFAISDSQDQNQAREDWWQRDIIHNDAAKENDFKKKLSDLSADDPRRTLLSEWNRIWEAEVSDKYDWIRLDLLAVPKGDEIERDRKNDRNILEKFAAAPWEEKSRADWERVRGDYELAAKVWRQAAADEKMSWDDFEKALFNASETHVSHPRIKELLNDWKLIFKNRKSWTLKILEGKTPKASDSHREIAIYQHSPWAVAEGWMASGSITETWKVPTTRPEIPAEKITFTWQHGYPIRLMMWGGRSLWSGGARPELFDQTISGPVPLWRLRDPRSLTDPASGASLTVSIQDCPGPPFLAKRSPE